MDRASRWTKWQKSVDIFGRLKKQNGNCRCQRGRDVTLAPASPSASRQRRKDPRGSIVDFSRGDQKDFFQGGRTTVVMVKLVNFSNSETKRDISILKTLISKISNYAIRMILGPLRFCAYRRAFPCLLFFCEGRLFAGVC